MSLLLDALKRAEQSKQARQADAPAGEEGMGAAPTFSAAKAEPKLTLELEAAPSAAAAKAAPRPTPESSDRDSARNVFAAKQPASSGGSRAKWLIPVLALLAIGIGAGGWFVWKEVSRLSGSTTVRTPAPPAPIIAVPQTAPASKPPAAPVVAVVEPPAAAAPQKAEPSRGLESASSGLSAAERAREDLARSLRKAESSRESPLTLKRTPEATNLKVSDELNAAYSALRGGNHTEAKRLYSALVAQDGNNIDARLGLATALARSNEAAAAVREYRKALEIDPRNSTALAALLVLSDGRNGPALETDLRALLTRYPDSSALSFAMGNLLASQSRWTEAQQAYFEAWRLEPENADYAFNLAVSLDQLKKPALALDYYGKALTLARSSGANFDRRQAERRLNELKSQQ